MAKNNNLQDFLRDTADAIRTKTGTTEPINAQDFSTKILQIPSGGENTLKKLLMKMLTFMLLILNKLIFSI